MTHILPHAALRSAARNIFAIGVVAATGLLVSCGGDSTAPPVTPVAGVLTSLTATVTDSPLEIGQGTQASVQGKDAFGSVVALGTRTVTWSSSNAIIATINANGAVQGVGVGATTIGVSVVDGSKTITGTSSLTVTAIANAPQSSDVSMLPQQFVPFQTVVKVGGSVRFFFTSIDHNVIWNPRLAGSPTDILVTVNTNVSRTFPTMGVYKFECTVHPGMVGVIVVSP